MSMAQMFSAGCLLLMSMSGVALKSRHMLSILIMLEGCLLGVVFFLSCVSLNTGVVPVLIMLVMSVCEGAMGLGVVVSMVRSHGNDYVLSLSSQQC